MGRQPRIDFYPPSSRPCPCRCPNSNQGPSFSRGQRGTSLFSLGAGPGEQEGLLEERRRRKGGGGKEVEERGEARGPSPALFKESPGSRGGWETG